MELSSRERVTRAIQLQEPDRVPVDLGGSVSSAISVGACNALEQHLGFRTETKVLEVTFQMAHVEEPIARALGIDTRPVYGNPPAKGNRLNERGEYVDELSVSWGGIDTQKVLHQGSLEEVRQEVRKRIGELGPDDTGCRSDPTEVLH